MGPRVKNPVFKDGGYVVRGRTSSRVSLLSSSFFAFGGKEHVGELIISQEPRHGTEERYSSSDVVAHVAPPTMQFFRIIILSSLPTIERKNRLETAFRVERDGTKVTREFIVALQRNCFSSGLDLFSSRWLVLAKKMRESRPSDTCPRINRARAHGGKPERLCKWGGGGLEASTPFAYIHPCSARWINTFFFPTLENQHQGKCLLRRSTREQSKLFNLSSDLTRCTTKERERNFTEKRN